MKRGQLVLLLVTLLAVAGMSFAPMVAAAPTENDPLTDHLTYGAFDEQGTAPGHLFVNGSVTTAQQDLAEGTSHVAIAGYEDDSGVWVADGDADEDFADGQFVVNTSYDEDDESGNIYSFKPGHIVDSSYSAFPDKSGRTWTNATGWTEVTGASNGTVTNTTVAADVDAVHFDTSTNGDSGSGQVIVYSAKYNRWDGELDSDESKRVLQLAMDIDTLDANTLIEVRAYDESGDYKQVVANGSKSDTTDTDVFADGTGDFVYQVKLSSLSTVGGGSWDNIENVTVQVNRTSGSTGDADFSISWLDLRKKAKNVLAEQRATTDDDGNDNDGDGDYDEIQTVYNASGDISTHDMGTLDTEYDDAVVNDLTYPFRYDVTGLERNGQEGTYRFAWEDPVNPQFSDLLNLTVSVKLPAAVDLSYSNTETRLVQAWDDGRYVKFESASGVADSTNLSKASFSDDSSSLGSAGTTITIDSSTSAGERIVLQLEMELSGDERTGMEVGAEATETGGAAAPAEEGGGGGILGFGLGGDIAAALVTFGAFLLGLPQRLWRGVFG